MFQAWNFGTQLNVEILLRTRLTCYMVRLPQQLTHSLEEIGWDANKSGSKSSVYYTSTQYTNVLNPQSGVLLHKGVHFLVRTEGGPLFPALLVNYEAVVWNSSIEMDPSFHKKESGEDAKKTMNIRHRMNFWMPAFAKIYIQPQQDFSTTTNGWGQTSEYFYFFHLRLFL